jgi:hypothetical protein
MSIYTNSIALVKRMVKKYGAQVSWTVAQTNPDAEAIVKTPFVVFKTDNAAQAFTRWMNNSNISFGNCDAVMAQQTFTPTMFDTIVRNGKTFSIKSLNPVQPGNEVIAWKIELNK